MGQAKCGNNSKREGKEPTSTASHMILFSQREREHICRRFVSVMAVPTIGCQSSLPLRSARVPFEAPQQSVETFQGAESLATRNSGG